jgi:hypothetical protein
LITLRLTQACQKLRRLQQNVILDKRLRQALSVSGNYMRDTKIEELYHTFSTYSLANSITGCHCNVCLDADYEAFLLTTPLRELTSNNLTAYLQSVDIIDAACNDFKYFLPRILEIIFEERDQSNFFFEAVWNVLSKPNYLLWPRHEVITMNKFFELYYQTVKSTFSDPRNEFIELDFQKAGLWKNGSLIEINCR